MNAYIKTVEALGYADVANEMANIISPPEINIKNTIPIFFCNNLQQVTKNIYVSWFGQKRRDDFTHTIFHEADIEKISNALKNENPLFDQKIFDKLSQDYQPPKNQIFKPEFLKYFVDKENHFLTSKYFDFITKVMRIQLALLSIYNIDLTYENILTEEDLKTFIELFTKRNNYLEQEFRKESNKEFLEYYLEIVAHHFIFTLSSFQNVKIEIPKLIKSPIFFQFIFVDQLSNSPFTIRNALKVYDACTRLITTDSPFLSEAKIKRFAPCCFTNAFTKRLFEVIQADSDCYIDFTVFLQIYYSLNYINSRPGTQFFFQVVDLDSDGYISRTDILYFYKGITFETKIEDDFDSFLSKLLDIIGCKEENVTEEVLFHSQNQDLFFKLLIDMKTFSKWENQNSEEEEEEDKISYFDDDVDLLIEDDNKCVYSS
ncbi:Serine/threonine-protein phosphatase 2A regulatory subunit B'' subunit gamma [Tritrichomonas musculus]|uniref:Serine/threonine-protein phosphatase 2A regulatory subunit B'' subunit gamma n=1 Tax=Tritrichomonas musculus TaxID=1915356 RepID=A0ABR2JVY9_9EUKA